MNDLLDGQYSTNKNMRFKTLTVRSDGYIAVKGTLDLYVTGNNTMTQKGVVFKSNTPFRSCISIINNSFIDNAEDLDIVLSMNNLLQYNEN